MDSVAGQRIQVRRQRCHQRLAFARAHFGDLAQVQRQAADQLHVEMPQAELAPRSLPHQRERLGNQGIERCTAGNPSLELECLLGEVIVPKCLHFGLEEIGVGHPAAQLFDEALITAAENLRQKLPHAEGVLTKTGQKAGYCTDRQDAR
jgi:hypothetical protein